LKQALNGAGQITPASHENVVFKMISLEDVQVVEDMNAQMIIVILVIMTKVNKCYIVHLIHQIVVQENYMHHLMGVQNQDTNQTFLRVRFEYMWLLHTQVL